jgi:peptidoglycan/LPS O-acetylase OafA/YrhL
VNTRAYHFPLLDSVRGIAALAVVVAHASLFMSFGGDSSLSHARFDFSPRLFFMLSAFLLYRPWVRARLAEWQAPSALAFGWRRLLRIIPAYWVALTAIALWIGLPYVFTGHGIWTYYGLLQVYQPDWAVGGLPQAWSLSVEIGFYAMLPLWGALMRRVPAASNRAKLRQELIGCGVLFLIGVAYTITITATGAIDGHEGTPFQLNTLTFLDDFAIGMALGVLSAWYEGRKDLPRLLRIHDRYPAIVWGIAVALFFVTSVAVGVFGSVGSDISGPEYVARHYLLAAIAVCTFLPAAFGEPSHGLIRRRVLSNRVLRYCGLVSYDLYLWHFVVLLQLQRWHFGELAADTSQLIWIAAALAGGMVLASISWFVVSKPCLSLKRLVKTRPTPQPGEAIAEPTKLGSPRVQTQQ